MDAVQLLAPQDLRHIQLPEPARPGPGEALVSVARVGICGTDISAYLGKMPLFQYPRVPGHELGVQVLEVGPGVVHVQPGEQCAVEPYLNCGRCLACRKGATNCCRELKVLGVMVDGGLCERMVVRADKLHPSARLSLDQLALVETLAIGCHAVERARVATGENCLIIGAGPIGLAVLEFVKLAGARALVLDLNEQRLEFCRRVKGADETLVPTDRLLDDLRELTAGDLPDVVFDATGAAASMSAAFGYVAQTGRLVFVGITAGEVTFRHAGFHRAEGTLLCSRNALAGDFTRIIGLIEAGRIDTGPWITHRAPLRELAGMFPSFTRPEARVIKALVECSPG